MIVITLRIKHKLIYPSYNAVYNLSLSMSCVLFFSPLLTLAPWLVKEHTELLLNSKFFAFVMSLPGILFLPNPLLSYLPTSTRFLQRCHFLQHLESRHRVICLSEITTFSTPLFFVFCCSLWLSWPLKIILFICWFFHSQLPCLTVMFITTGICLAHSSQWTFI